MPPGNWTGNTRPQLIAHRGWPARHAENSLAGLEAAAEAGARYVEFDVQLSADGVPLLIHDDNLARTTGVDMEVITSPAAMLRSVVEDPHRLPTVAEAAEWLAGRPGVSAFVELKRASLRAFGAARVMRALRPALRPVLAQCQFISFARESLRHARNSLGRPVGWVVPGWDDHVRRQASELAPDYLFIDHRLLTPDMPIAGDWIWVTYTVDDPEQVLALGRRGMRFVETDDFGRVDAGLRDGGDAAR